MWIFEEDGKESDKDLRKSVFEGQKGYLCDWYE